MKTLIPACALLLLGACGDPDAATRNALAASAENAADDGRVECAVDESETFERVCLMERLEGADGTTLTIHHPSGAFRRLLVTTDGRGVVAADGADPAIVSIVGQDRIEAALAGDRYRLPATVKGSAR